MKLLWAYDHYFYQDADTQAVYSRSHFPSHVWNRYLKCATRLTVAARERSLSKGEKTDNIVRSDRPELEFLFVPSLTNPLKRISSKRDALKKLKKAIEECDGVIARMPSEIGMLAAQVAIDQKKPWVAEVVGCAWDMYWNYGSVLGKAAAPLARKKMKSLISQSQFALYVTETTLQKDYPSNGRIVNASNVILPELIDNLISRRIARIEAAESPLKIGLIGYLGSKIKGIHIALRALRDNQRKLPPFKLEIVGGGDPSPWKSLTAEYGLAEQVSFKGLVKSGQPILDWLETVDLYLQPSFQEGLPRATIEALSRGCPTLGSTAGGIGELLPDTCLHKPGDHKTLGKQLVQLANDRESMKRSALSNFETAKRYQQPILDSRRDAFYASFARSIKSRS